MCQLLWEYFVVGQYERPMIECRPPHPCHHCLFEGCCICHNKRWRMVMAWRIQVFVFTTIAWLSTLLLISIKIPSFGEDLGEERVLWTLIPNQTQLLPLVITECNGPGGVELIGHSYSLFSGSWISLGIALSCAFIYGVFTTVFSTSAMEKP